MLRAILAAFLVAHVNFRASAAESKVSLANGWGDQYNWNPFSDAYTVAEQQDKPVMLIIWKTWCGACKSLRPKFAESGAIAALANDFVMVNVVDDAEPPDVIYKPDGGYIPRILFIQKDGTVMNDIVNVGGNDKYKYYYHNDESIAASMARAKAKVSARNEL